MPYGRPRQGRVPESAQPGTPGRGPLAGFRRTPRQMTGREFTPLYRFCSSFRHSHPEADAFRMRRSLEKQLGGPGWVCKSVSLKLPTLRFRGKVMLGFAVVLAITAVSMGFAYLGFERVSSGVTTYRNSVSEADLARNIDRELISYRALARYYVVTGKEEDAKAALAAEASLKDAIDQSVKGTTDAARRDQVTRLAAEFGTFSKIFADTLKFKRDSALVTQNQLLEERQHAALQARRSAQQCRRRGRPAGRIRCQKSDRAVSGGDGARQYLRHQCRPDGCRQRAGAPQIRR